MKRISVFIIIFTISLIMLNAQSISVTAPRTGNSWDHGETKTISWIKTGTMHGLVKIRLYNEAGVKVFDIVDSTDNDGNYSWTVPETIGAGNYMLRVKTIDNRVFGDSGFFGINPVFVSTGNISVLTPDSSTVLHTSTVAQNINWTNTGDNHENVSILIFTEGSGSSGTYLISNTPNDGNFNWTTPGSLAPGRYYIRVVTLDAAVWGDSEVFVMAEPPSTPASINITSPESRSVWNVNTGRMIGWWKHGEMADQVMIRIYDHTGTTVTHNVADRADNTEEHPTYGFHLPADHPEGRFFVRITTIDGLVTDDSEIFPITRPGDSTEPPPPPPPPAPVSIKIKFPNTRSVWRAGQKAEIVWEVTRGMHDRVKIELIKDRVLGVYRVISLNTKNEGKFIWKIPIIFSGGKYSIKITALDKSAHGSSRLFLIKSRILNLKTKK